MPRTRRLETYPNERFLAVINRTLTDNAPFLIACTQAQAASIRGEIYAWRRAAEDSPAQAAKYGIDLATVREVAFRIGPEGLTALPASMLLGPSLIDKALGGAPVSKPSEAALALKRMQGMLKESDRG